MASVNMCASTCITCLSATTRLINVKGCSAAARLCFAVTNTCLCCTAWFFMLCCTAAVCIPVMATRFVATLAATFAATLAAILAAMVTCPVATLAALCIPARATFLKSKILV